MVTFVRTRCPRRSWLECNTDALLLHREPEQVGDCASTWLRQTPRPGRRNAETLSGSHQMLVTQGVIVPVPDG